MEYTDKQMEQYMKEQVKRISNLYKVILTNQDLDRIENFNNEHLIDSHALCDLIELVCKTKSG